MSNAATHIAPNPTPRLLSSGGSSLLCQLATQTHAARLALQSTFRKDCVVAVFATHNEAEDAVRELLHAGVDMRTLSIAARNTDLTQHVTGFYTAGDRMLHWGKIGALCGAIWGFVFDTALFAIPGIGPVLLAGPLVSWIVAVLEGATVFAGVSALGAGLLSIGIPRKSVIQYENDLRTEKFLLIVQGTSGDVKRAARIVGGTRHAFGEVHNRLAPA